MLAVEVFMVPKVSLAPLGSRERRGTRERGVRREIVAAEVLLILVVCTFAGVGPHVLMSLELNWSTLEELGAVKVVLPFSVFQMILNTPSVMVLDHVMSMEWAIKIIQLESVVLFHVQSATPLSEPLL